MDPFVGQLSLMAFPFAPRNWAQCNGTLIAINTNQALFSLLGTFFGGDGIRTFGLPNLQGRIPIGISGPYPIGSIGGETSHTLSTAEVPPHTHVLNAATSGGSVALPTGALVAGGGTAIFAPPANALLNGSTITSYGGNQPHENRQPFLVMNWCISLNGVYPSQN